MQVQVYRQVRLLKIAQMQFFNLNNAEQLKFAVRINRWSNMIS